MLLEEKLAILADSAKYDVSCASSGSEGSLDRFPGPVKRARLGNTALAGVCHSWSADGRCISLLKVLFSNVCMYDCAYCVNRRSNDRPRASFTPEELVHLTLSFYRRNYIEGLFLSSGILRDPDYTMARLIRVVELLRLRERFGGYIHLKAIPGADPSLIRRAGLFVDRLSVNIELPTEKSLSELAPQKTKKQILGVMGNIHEIIRENGEDRDRGFRPPSFVPAGQSTQLIVGATPESDLTILRLTSALYENLGLKRVYYSAFIPVNRDKRLPPLAQPPTAREHRLYQADWLLRFYGFAVGEILEEESPFLDPRLDPKAAWALRNPHRFPVEISTADLDTLLRVPGIGRVSARRILLARKSAALSFEGLSTLGVVMKRAAPYLTLRGRILSREKPGVDTSPLRDAAQLPLFQEV